MTAMLLKELRENARWAAVLSLLLLAALGWAVTSGTANDVPPLNSATEAVCIIGFAVAGIAMGMLVVLPDARRGRWQFVMHRPISRGRIFAAKALAAALLYLLATAIPLAAAIAWCAVPGHVAGPITADMILPRLAELLDGFIWLAAGLVVAARTARWLGSRLMPIASTVYVVAVGTVMTMHFWECAVIAAVGVAVLMVGAWGAFVAGGDPPRRAWVVRSILGLFVVGGLALVVGLALGLLDSAESTLWPPPAPPPTRFYTVLDDGRVVVSSYGSRFEPAETTDLQGRPVLNSEQLLSDHTLSQGYLSLVSSRPQDLSEGSRVELWGFHSSDSHVRPLVYAQQNWPTRWWYVASRNSIEEFDAGSRRYIGSLGPNGWSASPQAFPQKLIKAGFPTSVEGIRGTTIVAGDTQVWQLTLQPPQSRLLFTAPAGERVIDATQFEESTDKPNQHPLVDSVVLTDRAIYVFGSAWPTVRLAPPRHWPAYQELAIGRTTDGQLVLNQSPVWNGEKFSGPQVFDYVDAGGAVVRELQLPNLEVVSSGETTFSRVTEALAFPPAIEVGGELFDATGFDNGILGWIIGGIIGVMAAAVSVWLARRRQYSPAGVAAWAALNLLLGLPGLLLLISMDEAPATVRCPACGHRRPVTLAACPHCSAPFPSPARIGIEVFEPALFTG